MTKIMPEHLTRLACVYIRQSTADQLLHNQESQRRQYGLADRARALGWSSVEVIDDDLGRSGGGSSRPGFERLLSAICEGRVGAVFAIEASRLARNGREWRTEILAGEKMSATWTGDLPEVVAISAVDRNGNISAAAAISKRD